MVWAIPGVGPPPEETVVGGPATGLGGARGDRRPPGTLKPTLKPQPVSEAQQAKEADPRVSPEGIPLPRSGDEFRAQLPVPTKDVLAAAVAYCEWVTQEGAADRGKELLKGALDRDGRYLVKVIQLVRAPARRSVANAYIQRAEAPWRYTLLLLGSGHVVKEPWHRIHGHGSVSFG